LGNWHSILTRQADFAEYEVDGLIFAVYWYNLKRKFTTWATMPNGDVWFGRAPLWDPAELPQTMEQMRPYLHGNAYGVSPAQYDAALRGAWRPPRTDLRLPFLTSQISGAARAPRQVWWRTYALLEQRWPSLAGRLSRRPEQPTFEPGQLALVNEIRELAKSQRLPVLVVHIPSRESLISFHSSRRVPQDVREFAHRLDATFANGCEAFAGLSADEIRACFLPYDAHWNQAGSDRFAEWMGGVLREWSPVVRTVAGPEDRRDGA
jgi:hypothetical protein